jgi:anaerobic sulfite reductase subunit A
MENREKLYRFLGGIYQKEVDRVLLMQMKAMTFPSEAEEPSLTEGYQMLKDYLDQIDERKAPDPEAAITDLAADYAKIFLAAGISQGSAAFPFESVYTSPDRIIMQDAWETVRKRYESVGLIRNGEASGLFEDHIALELEFMAFLCEESRRDPDCSDWLIKQREFLRDHLLNWVPAFTADVKRYADTAFYKGIANITEGFLRFDREILEGINAPLDEGIENQKEVGETAFSLTTANMDQILQELKKEYRIFAPKRYEKRGAKSSTDLIRYGEIHSVREIVHEIQSDFSPKEIYYPITQTMIRFQENQSIEEPASDSRGVLIFARPCDINGIKRLDNIFLENGGHGDIYYERLRDKVRFVMMECGSGWDDCFCVSMETNKTEDYSLAVRFDQENLIVFVKDQAFEPYFSEEKSKEFMDENRKVAPENADFMPQFVTTNKKKVRLPKIQNHQQLKEVSDLEFWKEFDEQCIGCGGCSAVCGTCSCFDTVDIIYDETSSDGERRRVWSSCMLDTYTMTAGGSRFRKTPGANMRFKALHKVYDYNLRFGGDEHMCVGCGRCDKRCPKEISFFDIIFRLSEELESTACNTTATEVPGNSIAAVDEPAIRADISAGLGAENPNRKVER